MTVHLAYLMDENTLVVNNGALKMFIALKNLLTHSETKNNFPDL